MGRSTFLAKQTCGVEDDKISLSKAKTRTQSHWGLVADLHHDPIGCVIRHHPEELREAQEAPWRNKGNDLLSPLSHSMMGYNRDLPALHWEL